MTKHKFAVFDFDGTLIRWQLFMAILYELAMQGLIDEKDYQEVRKYFDAWKERSSEKAFEQYLKKSVEIFDKHAADLDIELFDKAVDKVFHKYKDQVYIYTRDLVKDLKAQGYYLIAISGSQHQIVEKISKYYGFDEWIGTKYTSEDNKLGTYSEFPAGAKDKALKKIIEKRDLTLQDSVGVGDTESDIPMLEMVENPIALNPSKGLLERAKEKKWKIIIERKAIIYELVYQDGKFVLA